MSQITVKLIGLDEAEKRIADFPVVLSRTLESPQVLRKIGTVLAASGEQTITEGGRPVKYKPLAESTIAAKMRKYKKESGILIGSGTLRNSLDYEQQGSDLYLTSVEYLKYHQFKEGRTKAKFPARPVWGVHDEDTEEITDIILDKLSETL